VDSLNLFQDLYRTMENMEEVEHFTPLGLKVKKSALKSLGVK